MDVDNEYENNNEDNNENDIIEDDQAPIYEKRIMKEKKAKGFRVFNLTYNIIQAIKNIGYRFPTPIQRKAIPEILSGFNVIAHSRTGYFISYI